MEMELITQRHLQLQIDMIERNFSLMNHSQDVNGCNEPHYYVWLINANKSIVQNAKQGNNIKSYEEGAGKRAQLGKAPCHHA